MSSLPQPAPAPATPPGHPPPRPQIVPSPTRRGPSRWRVWALVAAAGILAGGLYLALRQGQVESAGSADLVPTASVASGPMERIVRISGQTSARNFATIMVPVFRGPDSGRDLTLMRVAKPGSFVKKGDLVAELDPQALRDHIDDLDDAVQQAENDVAKKKAEQEAAWEALQQDLRVARAEFDKARLDLRAAEVKTPIERELLQLAADEAEAAHKQLQVDVARKKAADLAELRILEISVAQQRIHRGRHVGDLAKFTMRAPMDGLVVMLQVWRSGEMKQIQEGDQVYAGQQFMRIVDTSSMQLEAVVSQADSSELRVGQEASVGIDAFPDLRLRGRIYSIGALAVKGIWDTYYIRNIPVRVKIEGRDARLIPDLSGWAHVRIDGLASATLVPAEAIHREAGAEYVLVKRGQGFERRPVELGLRTPTTVAVLSGVRAGEQVALGAVK
jgi:HlyD family secretion protein